MSGLVFDHEGHDDHAKIKVIGVGGGGSNAVNNMIETGLAGVDFIIANTDAQALARNRAPVKIQIGENVTRGLGAGAKPDVGRKSAEESQDRIREALHGADMVFITAGMGGGTGTGAAPAIARIAREMGVLAVAVVTKPFQFEGKRRMQFAEEGLADLRKNVDTVITIPNQKLLDVVGKNTSLLDAFRKADEVLYQAVRGITDLITIPGLINVDFADVRTVMDEMGMAMMGAAEATGDNRALEAATKAISSPLLDDISIHGAKGVLINITGGMDISLQEVDEAATVVRDMAHEDAIIVFGAVVDESMQDRVRVTVVATGIGMAEAVRFPTANAGIIQPKRAGIITPPGVTPARSAAPAPAPAPRASKVAAAQKEAESEKNEVRSRRRMADLGVFSADTSNEENFDVPTFLRRQAD
ncbi:MAG: cell division protein FtsZ [Magnetococcales bacterium]|nr:cell division protein FtsZ [Magnetococcales bacterium]